MTGIPKYKLLACLAGAFILACAGGTPPPEEPDEDDDFESDLAAAEALGEGDSRDSAPRYDPDKDGSGKDTAAGAEPAFTDGMSVAEAVNAVPQGTERVNIDEETLGLPLRNYELYEPCKPRPSDHFKMKVAVWEGRAVGIDVTATPKNPKLEQCVKDQIKQITWRDKVRSLNTVEYAF
jgi:hypothetical protein